MIVALNAGSSSLKAAAFELKAGTRLEPAFRAHASIGSDGVALIVRDGEGGLVESRRWPDGRAYQDAARQVIEHFRHRLGATPVPAVGHRIVHGGPRFGEPRVLDRATVAGLEALRSWAPLHQSQSLAALDLAREAWPGAIQVGCFDTDFHRDQPAAARRLGLPRAFEAEGVRRYGFHGLSCESAMGRLGRLDAETAAGRVLIAHLGSGASLTAVHAGRSVDSSMGFSPLDGLVMGTRCGALDPGVVLFLEQAGGMSPAQVEDLLYRRSGLLGVSGVSADMRTLLALATEEAREAVELFVFRAAREAGALVSSMQGLDGIVFTGGIGESAPAIRHEIGRRLAWLGVSLDEQLNQSAGDRLVSAPESRVRVWVLAADEEAVIARACTRITSLAAA